MILDNQFNFASQQAIGPANTDVVSTNVFDAGSAVKLFAGGGKRLMRIACMVTAVGGTNPNMRMRFVGADDAALTTNPIILADTGVGPTLTAGALPLPIVLSPQEQQTAKRYYGVIFTQGGNANNTATVNAQGTLDVDDNLLR